MSCTGQRQVAASAPHDGRKQRPASLGNAFQPATHASARWPQTLELVRRANSWLSRRVHVARRRMSSGRVTLTRARLALFHGARRLFARRRAAHFCAAFRAGSARAVRGARHVRAHGRARAKSPPHRARARRDRRQRSEHFSARGMPAAGTARGSACRHSARGARVPAPTSDYGAPTPFGRYCRVFVRGSAADRSQAIAARIAAKKPSFALEPRRFGHALPDTRAFAARVRAWSCASVGARTTACALTRQRECDNARVRAFPASNGSRATPSSKHFARSLALQRDRCAFHSPSTEPCSTSSCR